MTMGTISSSQNVIPWICTIIIMSLKFLQIEGHGRLIEPPSRASMWRYGFNTPPNYNDHELFCGGFSRQWQTNGGKCGICGDAWDAPQPRPHEAGGKYGQGIIVRKYKTGSSFTIRIELTANHKGFFEFKLCPNNAAKKVATQQCLDKYTLKRAKLFNNPDEIFHETRFYPGNENKVYEMKYMLPANLTCSQCVLQWRYIAGNNWGMCSNGTGAIGCGPQEEFRACSDISIHDATGIIPVIPDEKETTSTTTTTVRTISTTVAEISSTIAEETTADIHENEIPDEEIDESFKNAQKRKTQEYVLFMASVIIFSFVLVITIFVLMYFYYYHAGDKIQKWRSTGGFGLKQMACWTTIKNKIHATCSTNAVKQKNIKQCIDEKGPVPPPRTKKNTTIGFKGVPDNLV